MNTNALLQSEPDTRPDGVSGRLARSLTSQRLEIINEWLERVREDPTVPTDSLTLELIRHLPALMDDLNDHLSRYASEVVSDPSRKHAAFLAAERRRHGSEPQEMLRELIHLRFILINRLRRFETQNEDFGIVARLFVTATIHGFLVRMGITAAEQLMTQESDPGKFVKAATTHAT